MQLMRFYHPAENIKGYYNKIVVHIMGRYVWFEVRMLESVNFLSFILANQNIDARMKTLINVAFEGTDLEPQIYVIERALKKMKKSQELMELDWLFSDLIVLSMQKRCQQHLLYGNRLPRAMPL